MHGRGGDDCQRARQALEGCQGYISSIGSRPVPSEKKFENEANRDCYSNGKPGSPVTSPGEG